jgi:hypothetical protein
MAGKGERLALPRRFLLFDEAVDAAFSGRMCGSGGVGSQATFAPMDDRRDYL